MWRKIRFHVLPVQYVRPGAEIEKSRCRLYGRFYRMKIIIIFYCGKLAPGNLAEADARPADVKDAGGTAHVVQFLGMKILRVASGLIQGALD